MRILLVTDYGAPIGGAEVATLMLRDALRRRGHDARLLATSAAPVGMASRADAHVFGTTGPGRTLLQMANPSAMRGLRSTLEEFQPDVVHVVLFLTQLSPLILPLLRPFPSLYQAVWYRAVCPLGTKTLPDGTPCVRRWGLACRQDGCVPRRDWVPLMLQMAAWTRWRDAFSLFVANSEAVRRQLVDHGIEPVTVIQHSVPRRPERAPLSDPPRVVFAGRLVPEKGAAELLRAFARAVETVPDARLTVAGDGPERERLTRLVDRLGLASAVELVGFLSREELERRFTGAWVQAVPSRWAEPFGLVAAESMMRGTAVVASRCGGLQEIVDHGRTGLLVPPGDVDALSGALVRLLTDRTLADRLGRAGHAEAQARYGEGVYADRFEAVYRDLLDAH